MMKINFKHFCSNLAFACISVYATNSFAKPKTDPTVDQDQQPPELENGEKTEKVDKKETPERKANLVLGGAAYIKPLGAIKSLAPKGWQYGAEWNRLFPVRKNKWQTHFGFTYRRSEMNQKAELTKVNSESKISLLRTDYLILYGYSFGSGNKIRPYADLLAGLLSRRLLIRSGSPAIADDYSYMTNWGAGLRLGLEIPFVASANNFICRVGAEYLMGAKMQSTRLRYSDEPIDINGPHVTAGIDFGWLF